MIPGSLRLSTAIDRRRLLAASALALLAAAPRSGLARQEATPAADGEWSFVDDFGVTISRPRQPERIVAYLPLAAALWDFGVRPVAVYGTTRRADGSPEIYVGNVDLDAVASLGETYGELDLEQLVALQPDLIVNDKWAAERDVWGLPADTVAQVEAIAPIASLSFVDQPVTATIGRVADLAAALGADVEAPEVVAARERLARAEQDLQAAIAAKPGLKVIFISATTDNLWVGNPAIFADLLYFKELGLDIVQPETPDEYFEELSWEQAARYPADLILLDARSFSSTLDQLQEIPTFSALPAVKAGQIAGWQTEYVPGYADIAAILEDLTATIEQSRADVV